MGQNPDCIGKSLLKVRLSDKQWEHIHKINTALIDEYKTRREMLLKRLDVTIQSFMWSDKAKVRYRHISYVVLSSNTSCFSLKILIKRKHFCER